MIFIMNVSLFPWLKQEIDSNTNKQQQKYISLIVIF